MGFVMTANDEFTVAVSELLRLFRQVVIQQKDLADKLEWNRGPDIHDAWDNLLRAAFDSIVRQPIEADRQRSSDEFRMPPFNFRIAGGERCSWIAFKDSPTSQAIWGVDVLSHPEPRLMVSDIHAHGQASESLPWRESDEFVFVGRGPGMAIRVAAMVSAVE